jgi:CHAT domain-containing protein
MEDFYALWRQKEERSEPCEALRFAQLALRDSGYAHPYYWAAFTYSGV